MLAFSYCMPGTSVPVTKPQKSPGLRKSGLCDKKEDGLHTPPAGNIFFCVVIIGDKTETKAAVYLIQYFHCQLLSLLAILILLCHNLNALPGLGF